MKILLTLLLATLCAATGYGQTLKALMVNTTNGQVVYGGTNGLTFTNDAVFNSISFGGAGTSRLTNDSFYFGTNLIFSIEDASFSVPVAFAGSNTAAATRTNLALGATNSVHFASLLLGTELTINGNSGVIQWTSNNYIDVESGILGSGTNSNLGWSGAEITVGKIAKFSDNIVITNQTATNNGILFIYRTNNEPFLGLANLIASNNTTISNETLFRVGTAEATNRSAQFGFRSTNTNGSGVAVFSVFGFNALMMVGADASTNAVIYSGGGTNNEVMTLIRDGATEFARPIRFSTNASTRPATNAPANATNVAAWVEFRIGTNSYRAPLYQ